ncbi:hypothetical protein DB30_06838 [Enhygromyxa salina]|uniref:SMP-30/Gluconolactonase/LRE-like region domain-containing protein n=1 Tax=Enhygromyxa salina TaxID=215803 RepID=A0A0C1ZTH7_9BACT|nr:hypothetical protein DB30_06838 [Enhygromyxa salina]
MLPLLLTACQHDGEADDTSAIGLFDGLFDGVATGLNYPLDIGVAPDDLLTEADIEGGDIYLANYGTSEIMWVRDPTGAPDSGAATPIFDGTSAGFAGPTAISVPTHARVWAAFEQGGSDNAGGIAILDQDGALISTIDGSDNPDAFANPGGLCYGGRSADGAIAYFYLVNLGDGTAWRIEASTLDGDGLAFTQIGSGLATGTPGNPGSPGNGLSSSSDLPQGGARGCAYDLGSLYVADMQNDRVVRFDDAATNDGIDGVALEDLPAGNLNDPTDLTVNAEGYLIIVSYENAKAFLTVELPRGGFIDNGLQDLSVNAGNYGVAVASGTVWFTRANNKNGTLRAVTPEQDVLPTTEGPFPPQ